MGMSLLASPLLIGSDRLKKILQNKLQSRSSSLLRPAPQRALRGRGMQASTENPTGTAPSASVKRSVCASAAQ